MPAHRIVFEFLLSPEKEQREWNALQHTLSEYNATLAHPPEGNPPYILLAIVSDEQQAPALMERLRGHRGVGRVETDSLRRAL